jgi:hypothetical protein
MQHFFDIHAKSALERLHLPIAFSDARRYRTVYARALATEMKIATRGKRLRRSSVGQHFPTAEPELVGV